MKQNKSVFYSFRLLVLISIASLSINPSYSQNTAPYIRIAKITVDSLQLSAYNSALKEHAEAAVQKEPGVLALYAVSDKDHPTNITVFEIYASVPAYQSHIKTPHFLKYKSTVAGMVVSLQLTDMIPIVLEDKHKKRK